MLTAPSINETSPATARRLRIAFIVHDYTRTIGHSRYVVELATRYRDHHEVHVYANRFDDNDDVRGIVCHQVPAIRSFALASILSFIAPATWMAPRNFDIVHSQGLCGLRHDVATAHICQAAWYEEQRRALGKLSFRQQLSRWLITPLERMALTRKGVARVIAVSHRIRTDLARHYGRTNGVDVVYHGTDVSTFHPERKLQYRAPLRTELGLKDSDLVALFVGNLEKGAATAIRAIAGVPDVRLVLVSGSQRGDLPALVESLGIQDRVIFRSHTSQVQQYYAMADVFLFPTFYESFGLVITEAMASGLPVITTRAAGAAELVEHLTTGWLIDDPRDVAGFRDALHELAVDSRRRERMQEAAWSAMQRHTWDTTAAETLRIYDRILAERTATE